MLQRKLVLIYNISHGCIWSPLPASIIYRNDISLTAVQGFSDTIDARRVCNLFCSLHNSTFQREGAKHSKNWTFQYISRKILCFCPHFWFVLCPNLENIWWKLANCRKQNLPYFAKTFTVKVSSRRKQSNTYCIHNNELKEVSKFFFFNWRRWASEI